MKGSLIDSLFKGNVIFSYGTQAMGIMAGFISVTLITRYGGIDIYGMVAMMIALSGVLSQLLTFRTNEAVVNFYKRGKIKNIPGLCRLALLTGILLDIAVGVLLFFLVKSFANLISNELLKYPGHENGVMIFAGFMLASFLRATPVGFLMAEERFRLINSLKLVEQILKIVFFGIMLVFGMSLTFENIMWAMLISAVFVSLIVYIILLQKLFGPLRSAAIPYEYLSEYGRFGLSTFLSSSLKAGSRNIDTIILGYLTNPANVGIYNLFRQFLSPILMLSAPFTVQIYPRFVHAVTENKPNAIQTTVAHANRILLRGSILVLVLIVPVLVIYGKWNALDFRIQHYTLFALMVISTFISQRLWWSRPFSISINPVISIKAGILATITLPIMVYFFVTTIGFVGVGVGILVTYIILYLFWNGKLYASHLLVNTKTKG